MTKNQRPDKTDRALTCLEAAIWTTMAVILASALIWLALQVLSILPPSTLP